MDKMEWIIGGALFTAVYEFGAHCAVEHYGILQSATLRPVRYVMGVLGFLIPFTAWAVADGQFAALAALWALVVSAAFGTGLGYWIDGVREGKRLEADLEDIGFPIGE